MAWILYIFVFKGNVLINIGPTKEGIISPIFKERLLQIGDWLKVNGEAIYNSSRYVYRQDPINKDAWYTTIWYDEDSYFRSRFKYVYTIFLKWPENNVLTLQGLSSYLKTGKNFTIQLLNNEGDTTSLKVSMFVRNYGIKIIFTRKNARATTNLSYEFVVQHVERVTSNRNCAPRIESEEWDAIFFTFLII